MQPIGKSTRETDEKTRKDAYKKIKRKLERTIRDNTERSMNSLGMKTDVDIEISSSVWQILAPFLDIATVKQKDSEETSGGGSSLPDNIGKD